MNRAFFLFLVLALPGRLPARSEDETPAVQAYRLGARARIAEMQNKHEEALGLFDRSLALVPDAIIFSNRGDLKKKLKDIPGAIADYDKAIAMKPKGLETLYGNRALMKHHSGDLDGAIADYGQVILLEPNAIVYNNRGYARGTKGDAAGAIADYIKAVELEPKTIKFRENLSNARRDLGDFAGAIADYEKIVALEPGNPLHYYNRSALKQLKPDLAGALADSDKVVSLAPDVWFGVHQRGVVRDARGDFEGAFADYSKAVSLTKNDGAFCALHREISARRLKRDNPGDFPKVVAAWGPGGGLHQNIGHYLTGEMPEAEFLAKAGEGEAAIVPAQRCTALYFAGMARLLAGDKATAALFFEQSVAEKATGVSEFVLARAELARLKPAPVKTTSER